MSCPRKLGFSIMQGGPSINDVTKPNTILRQTFTACLSHVGRRLWMDPEEW